MTTRFVSLTLATLACFSTPALADELWQADYDAAAALARKEGKDLLVDFTGSDWCGWCIRLHEEVFDHEAFQTAALKDYVLVALDFPRGDEAKANVPNPERNDELAKKHAIRGFPTILLMTADGEVYAQTGYREGGPEEYVRHLAEIRTSGRAALTTTKEVVAAFDAAEGDAKVALWERAVGVLANLDGDSPFAAQLAAPVRWALTADAKNEKGMKLRAVQALLGAGQVDDDVVAAGRELDPQNAQGMIEKIAEARFSQVQDDTTARAALAILDEVNRLGFRDQELGFRFNFLAANWCDGPLNDKEAVQKYAKAAKAIGNSDPDAIARLEELLGDGQ